MNALWWWATGLSGLGVVGLVLAFFFANAAFWLIVNGFMWFFRTRIGFGIVVGVSVWYGASWYQSHIDTKAFEAEKAAFKAAQVKRDADIRKDAEVFVRRQIADEFMAQQESNDALANFTKALDPAGVCRIGADAPKLRLLTSAGRSQSADHHRMRKAAPKKVISRDR